MSDPVIKGAKRQSSRPAPPSASLKSSAKSRKLTAKSASPKPKPKRNASDKAPVRKATPAKAAKASAATAGKAGKSSKAPKASKAAKVSRAATKQTKRAPQTRTPAGKARAAAPSKSKAAPKQPAKKQPAAAPAGKARKAAPKPATRHASPRPAPAPPRKPTVDEAAALKAFERAHKEFARGRFADARNLFRALIDQHAGVSEVTARARTYLTIAESRLRTETALPRDAEALYDRGVIELNRGEYVAAQELFERALKREPSAADSHYALAATRARLGSIELALQALERALQLRPVLRVRAQHDPDLIALRNEPEFERLVYAAPRP